MAAPHCPDFHAHAVAAFRTAETERRAAGYTHARFCRWVGIDPSHLSRMLSGERPFAPDLVLVHLDAYPVGELAAPLVVVPMLAAEIGWMAGPATGCDRVAGASR